MLNTTPSNLWEEYTAAKLYREQHMKSYKSRIRRYVGPAYDGEARGDANYEPENHEFEYLSLIVPKIAYDNPRVKVTTTRSGSQREVAQALQSGLNRWIRDVNLRRSLSRLATDMLLGWGCAMVVQEQNAEATESLQALAQQAMFPGDVGPVFRPKVHRISPKRIFWDPLALDISESRFIGHEWVMDKEDLLLRARQNPEEGWDYEAINGLSEDQGVNELRKGIDDKNKGNPPTRKEIVGIDIYIPGYQIEGQGTPAEGFNGAIFTLVSGSNAKGAVEIRAPRMAYGPPWGPYVFFGSYYVPDQTAPLAPTVAIHTQVRTLNLHARACTTAGGNRKRIAFVSKGDNTLKNAVKSALDGEVVLCNTEELNNNLKEVELGGITPAALQALATERERRDRISGMSDAMRGNVSGAATATENAIADEAGSFRMAFLKQQFSDAVTQLLRTVAWYLYKDDRTVFPLGQEAHQQGLPEGVDAGAPPEPWFQGGMEPAGSGASFQDLDLEIEAYSMERTSESVQQKRLMEVVQIITQVLPAAMQSPVDLQAMLNFIGDATNIPDLAKIINLPVATQIQGMMLQGMMASMLQPQPMMGGDAGLGKSKGVSPVGGSQPTGGMMGAPPTPKPQSGVPGRSSGNSAMSKVKASQGM